VFSTVTQAQELRSEPLQTMVLPARCSPAGLTGICKSLIRHRPKTDRLWTMAGSTQCATCFPLEQPFASVAVPLVLVTSSRPPAAEKERAFERVCALQTAHMDHLFERQRALAFSPSPLLLASMHAIHFSDSGLRALLADSRLHPACSPFWSTRHLSGPRLSAPPLRALRQWGAGTRISAGPPI
jgi:hypothetical protein